MKKYIIKRILQLLPILLGITFLSFAMMRLAGSDAVTEMYSNTGSAVSEEVLDAAREELGLNRPFLVQYFSWLGEMMRGNMGVSYISGRDVFATFVSKLPATLLLTVLSVLLTIVISVPLGILAAVKQGRLADQVLRFLSFIGNAMPNFFVALLLMQLLSMKLGWLPVISDGTTIRSAIMPMLTLAIAMSAKYMRQVRTAVLEELNLGGGYGIKYTEGDTPIDYDKYIQAVSKVVRRISEERGIPLPYIVMEPGRSITAETGLTVYRVGAVKEIPGVRTYISVDGGMGDNPRYILYQSEYEAVRVNNPLAEKTVTATLAGKCCESGDILIKDAKLPEIKVGDLVAVLATGAYNYSMASNYNRIPRLPIVMVSGGKSRLAVKRESYDDLIANDL